MGKQAFTKWKSGTWFRLIFSCDRFYIYKKVCYYTLVCEVNFSTEIILRSHLTVFAEGGFLFSHIILCPAFLGRTPSLVHRI